MKQVILCISLVACGPKTTDDSPVDSGDPPCQNLQCLQVECPAGTTTSITGTVHAPTPVDPDPLPNVTVYIPNAPVEPFAAGVQCTTCSTPPSGEPLVTTITAVDGTFRLENVPVASDVPIVIQSGRWRRQVTLDIAPCTDNPLPQDLSHLPRNRSQGDIPKMAIATGQLDSLECTLAKLIDPTEIGAPGTDARIHLYRLNGNDLATPVPSRAAMLADASAMLAYDALLLPCPSGEPFLATESSNLESYANLGGRLFVTHHGGDWMDQHGIKYPSVLFNRQTDPPVTEGAVNVTFERGKLFADWLDLIGATPTYGTIPITSAQHHVDSTQLPAQTWVQTASPTTVQHLTLNTPLAAQPEDQCGRLLFSNFHVAPGNIGIFPDACTPGPLTAQEKLVEFMLFDVTACVAPDVIL